MSAVVVTPITYAMVVRPLPAYALVVGGGGGGGVTGPEGPPGPQGDPGPPGADGADGADGATGATGATGPAGPLWVTGATPLFVPPASPNANDKEFDVDADATGSSFQVWDQNASATVTPSGAVDRFTSFSGTAPRHNLPSVGRKSFYKIQLPSTASFHYVTWTPAVAFPSTGFFWGRFGYQKSPACRALFGLFGDSGGNVDVNNWVIVGAHNNTGVQQEQLLSNNGGAQGSTTVDAGAGAPQWEYFGLYRVSATWQAFIWNDAGDALTFATTSNGFTPARWGFRVRSDGNLTAVLTIDFMRQAASPLGIID